MDEPVDDKPCLVCLKLDRPELVSTLLPACTVCMHLLLVAYSFDVFSRIVC